MHRNYIMPLGTQVVWLFIMALPIACIAWTVTHEEIFREPREYCQQRSENARSFFGRKFFYLFTCEYCFSHYVTAVFLIITGYKLLYQDWRGYLMAFFAFPFLSNLYIGLYAQTKLGVKKERTQIKAIQEETEVTRVKKERLTNGNSVRRPAA
jgi:amino acid permease